LRVFYKAPKFLLFNIAGKSVAKYTATSLDLADKNKRGNSQKIHLDDMVFKRTIVFFLDNTHLHFEGRL